MSKPCVCLPLLLLCMLLSPFVTSFARPFKNHLISFYIQVTERMVLKILQNYVDIVWACPTHNFEQYVNLLNGEWTDEWSPFNRQDWSPIQAETSALIFAIFLLELTWFKSGGRGVIRESIKKEKKLIKVHNVHYQMVFWPGIVIITRIQQDNMSRESTDRFPYQ